MLTLSSNSHAEEIIFEPQQYCERDRFTRIYFTYFTYLQVRIFPNPVHLYLTLKTNRLSPTCRASSAEGGKKPKPQPQRGNRAFGGFNPAADDFATSVTEKPAAGCALLIPGSGKPNQVKTAPNTIFTVSGT